MGAVRSAGRVGIFAWALILAAGGPGEAQVVGGAWRPAGPGPNTEGQVENVHPDDEVVGAIHTVAAHPTDADVLYAGAVNGGIWKTTSATATSPDWVRQSDGEASLSIGALEFDSTDPSHQTLVAGIGRYSSFRRVGGPRTGLLRTVDGGATWTAIDGSGLLVGKNISGVAPLGSTIVVSVNVAEPFTFANVGVFRSTDTGATFTQVSVGDGSGTGLPGGVAFDLVDDPSDPRRLFTSIVFADRAGGDNGVYRSTDAGATWAKVSSPAMDALILSGPTSNLEIAAGSSSNVFVAIANSGRLAGVFRSADGGDTWTAMDVPAIHPGGQAAIHLSIVADPTDPDIVYLGGDRQDRPGDLNAQDFSGRLFRGDAARPTGSQFVHLTHSRSVGAAGGGTLSASAPHADSREMVFDAGGDIIETDDGGIYRRTNPRSNQGDWLSLNGNIQTTEFHNVAYDSNANLVIGGAQDTGSSFQQATAGVRWFSTSTGDGGDVAVDDSSTPGLSTRYSSFQSLGAFRRQVFNAQNVRLSRVFPPLIVIGGGARPEFNFTNPVEINAVDARRLIIGASNGVYESLDQGDSIRQLAVLAVNASGTGPIAYGAGGNPDVLYVGSGDEVHLRTAAFPAALVRSAGYPGTGSGRTVVDVVLDPDDFRVAYVIDTERVFRTQDSAATWTEITGNLQGFQPETLGANAYLARPADDSLVVGASTGVFVAFESSGFSTWQRLGSGFPNVRVLDLDYDRADDVLVAGTLGRGAWVLSPTGITAECLHLADFESGTDGWTNDPESTCTTGSFVVGVPDLVVNGGVRTQVAGGNGSSAGNAFFTQPNTGGAGTDDVDGGRCGALSPVVATAGPVAVSLAFFHGQRDTGDDPSGDFFTLELLDGGAVIETLAAVGDVTSTAAWTEVTTTVSAAASLQLRLRVSDGAGPGDLVEAGVDDVRICPLGNQSLAN